MRYLLFLFYILRSALCAEMFDGSEVPYSYDIQINKDDSVIKYLVDSTYYDQFSAEVIGVYILYNDIPVRITKDLKKMAEILDHYIFLKENPNYKIPKLKKNLFSLEIAKYKFNEIRKSHKLFQITSQEFLNQEADARELARILEKHYDFTTKGVSELYSSLEKYLNKKLDFYTRQNNKAGLQFCYLAKKMYLAPVQMLKIELEENDKFNQNQYHNYSTIRDDYKKLAVKGLNKEELKLVWDEFKDSNLALIRKYFDANAENLEQLDANNSFQINLNYAEWNGFPKYYICLSIFGKKWYLRMDDYYVSGLHKVSLIKL